jgi:dUTP pyrophosphatase
MNQPPATAAAVDGTAAHSAGNAVEIAVLRLDPDLPLPAYAHPGDAGADLVTRVDVALAPGARATVPTGLAIALPDGYAGFVHPRSGLAARCGVTLVNAPGTVDAGYRGEIQETLLNTDQHEAVQLRRGERIAQLVVQRVERAVFTEVTELPGSVRGAGGHGSTGGFAGHAARPGTNVGADAPEGEAS